MAYFLESENSAAENESPAAENESSAALDADCRALKLGAEFRYTP